MKGVWDSIQKEHIVYFLVIFSLITIVGYFPEQAFESTTGLATGEGCTPEQFHLSMVSYTQIIPQNFNVGACCAQNDYCVSDHTGNPECYGPSTGGIDYDSDGRIESYCSQNAWYDCDQNAFSCSYSAHCNTDYAWTRSGEDNVGQYVNQELVSCCGDDANEYLIEDPSSSFHLICCNSPNDRIENGVCVSAPSQETLTLQEGDETEFEGKTITLERVSPDSIIIDVNDVERVIRSDEMRLVNGVLITVEDVNYDSSDPEDSEAEISLELDDRQELCSNNKDDDFDGIVDKLDTGCSGESVSIDRISVADGEVNESENFEVTCTLDLDEVDLDDSRDCVYVEVGDDICTDIDEEKGDDKLVFTCDSGLSEIDKDVRCVVDPDCNTGRSSRRTSIDVVEGDVCEDLDGDGACGVQDCNENNPNANYNLREECGDRVDNNCNNLVDENCCFDGVLNGDETRTDCGGTYCSRCGVEDDDDDDTPDSEDWDNDGLSNRVEFELGTNPYEPDTDGDGILDGVDPEPLKGEGGFSFLVLIFIVLIVIVLGLGSIIIITKTNKKKEKHINNPRLLGYIRQSRRRRVPEQQIVRALIQKGWDRKTIYEGLKQAKKEG